MSDILGAAHDLVNAYISLDVLAHNLNKSVQPSIDAVRALRQQAEQVEKLHDAIAGIQFGVPPIATPGNPLGV